MKLTVNRFASLPPRLGEGVTIADRFRLMRQIGEGGMGSVWLATHLGLGIPCAVKFVEGEWRRQPELVARFEREAKVEAQLRSPHVVHVLDHGVWNGTPYIAMEYMQGETLAQRLERAGSLDYVATHRLVAHIARALTRAHAVGIVHRDLKPENIFLLPDDDGEMAKVLDFGVAKYSTEWAVNSVTKTGLLVGTPLYMSPEQARGTKEIDYRADLWALGVIAFQCLTGQLPFTSEGLGDLLAKIMFEPIPVPSSIVPGLPSGFDAWWARASSRDPSVRFQTAKEMADSLATALEISTVVTVAAAPPGLREATMSDYSISTGETNAPPPPTTGRFWPTTRAGKLLGAGIFGVAAIVVVMARRAETDARGEGQTLVAPSSSSSPSTALAGDPAALPSDTASDVATAAPSGPATAALVPTTGAAKAAPHAADQHALRPEDLPHSPPPRSDRPRPPAPAARPAAPSAKPPSPPATPKHVDFGI
jgi:serine/threonine protein kinase